MKSPFLSSLADPRLVWTVRPPVLELTPDGLIMETAANTDLWQRTHYGFRRSRAHALLSEVPGDFCVATEVHFEPKHQYDQAGLLVWLSEACWLKASIEFEPHGPSRLGSVVTNAAWSDWATQDIAASTREARFRVTRRSGDYLVEYAPIAGSWSQIRIAHLHDDDGSRPVRAGIYACSPGEAGYRVRFDAMTIDLVEDDSSTAP